MENNTYKFGEWLVEPATNRLSRHSESLHIEPLAMDVLALLLKHQGQVVSADDVLDRVWSGRHGDPGMVKKRIGQLRRALGDDAKHPVYIETIAKRGYRAIAPVAEAGNTETNQSVGKLAELSDGSAETAGAHGSATETRKRRSGLLMVAAMLALLSLGLAVTYWNRAPPIEEPGPAGQRVAVAIFTHPQGDERLQNYAMLFRNELVHQLSRVLTGTWYLVQNAEDSDFVVTGTMNEAADGVRLLVQIVDATPGTILWSTNLSLPGEPTDDLLSTTPEHLATIVWVVVPVGSYASSLTDSTQAVREFIAGAVETNELFQGLGGNWNAGLAHFKRSSELDPQFILPLQSLADLYGSRMNNKLRFEEAIGPAHEYARRVLAIDENQTWQLGWMNAVLDLDYKAARANMEHARRMGHPASYAEFTIGLTLLYQGKLDEAIERFNTALRMGALGNQAAAYTVIPLAYFADGRYAAALRATETALVETAGTGPYAHVGALWLRVMALYYNGDPIAARETLELAWATYGAEHPELLVGAMALLGETDAAREALSAADARWKAGGAMQVWGCFWGHFYLGELDRAFVWLDRSIEDRQGALFPMLRRSPILEPIREDPRFVAAMKRLREIEARGTPTKSVAYP